jgi:hypothetical protein
MLSDSIVRFTDQTELPERILLFATHDMASNVHMLCLRNLQRYASTLV